MSFLFQTFFIIKSSKPSFLSRTQSLVTSLQTVGNFSKISHGFSSNFIVAAIISVADGNLKNTCFKFEELLGLINRFEQLRNRRSESGMLEVWSPEMKLDSKRSVPKQQVIKRTEAQMCNPQKKLRTAEFHLPPQTKKKNLKELSAMCGPYMNCAAAELGLRVIDQRVSKNTRSRSLYEVRTVQELYGRRRLPRGRSPKMCGRRRLPCGRSPKMCSRRTHIPTN